MNGRWCSRGELELQAYKPFSGIRDFYLAVCNKTAKFLFFYNKKEKKRYVLRIKQGGYIPKSGVFLCAELTKNVNFVDKTILDIGTGESGIIAIHASYFGAKAITAIDVDHKVLRWAKQNAKLNGIKNIIWERSDMFKNIKGAFDIIVSNPPQLPMKNGLLHDAGGIDGRKYIEEIIDCAPQHLHYNGKLILLIFDFLGVDKSYGKSPPLFDHYHKKNFQPAILGKTTRVIRKGGQTQKALDNIKMIYPRFRFREDSKGNMLHEVFVVSATIRK